MGLLVLLLWAVLAGALPDAAPAALGIARHPPDLYVALAAYLAMRSTGPNVVRWGILLGLLADCASLDPLGTRAFAIGVTTLAFSRRRGGSQGPTGPMVPFMVFAAALLAHLLYVVRVLPLHGAAPFFGALAAGFPVALWTALLSWPLLAVLDRTGAVDDLTGRHRARPA